MITKEVGQRTTELVALRTNADLDRGFPTDAEWGRSDPILFYADWQGKNEDPERRTEVRLLWGPETLFVRFHCNYRELTMFDNGQSDGFRDYLWERDVAEAFLQPDRFRSRYYKEFEVAPNGLWIDLDIHPDGRNRLNSGLRRIAAVDLDERVWMAQMAIPMSALTVRFTPGATWRANFYRCEGSGTARWYSAWCATGTPEPNFHVPESFGVVRFAE